MITIIDNQFKVSDIFNLDQLPNRLQVEIKSAQALRSYGFQELNGYTGRECMFSAGGYWTSDKNPDPNAKFVITSYGSHCYQWDGTILKSTVKIYV